VPPGIAMLSWEELTPELAKTIEADRGGLYIFLIILMGVVLLGVANTMMMSVMERTHELGVIQALGTTPKGIVGLVLSEIFWLGLLGVGAGTLLGVVTNLIAAQYGIPTGVGDFNYGGVKLAVMYPVNTFQSSVVFPLMILLSGMAAGLLPALKAAYTKPAEAMRD
nr:FtsX-like permease family protein [Acidobacteriota bacterium]